jgi:hypothetical protein
MDGRRGGITGGAGSGAGGDGGEGLVTPTDGAMEGPSVMEGRCSRGE